MESCFAGLGEKDASQTATDASINYTLFLRIHAEFGRVAQQVTYSRKGRRRWNSERNGSSAVTQKARRVVGKIHRKGKDSFTYTSSFSLSPTSLVLAPVRYCPRLWRNGLTSFSIISGKHDPYSVPLRVCSFNSALGVPVSDLATLER